MNLAALRTAVYARLGVDSSDGLFDTTTLNGFINDANHEVALVQDWPWLQAVETISTVSGTDTYTPGAANATLDPNSKVIVWAATDEMRDGVDAQVLERMTVTELDDRWSPAETGKPREWAIWADKLILRPVPDSVYTILHRYYREEGDLTADTDVPSMPVSGHAAIAALATSLALKRDRNDPRAQSAEAAYNNWVANLEKKKRRYRTPGRVRVRPGGWT